MKILVILPRFPYPLEKGDKLRAYHQIRVLAERHEIYLFALSHTSVTDEQKAELRRYCKEIRVMPLHKPQAALMAFKNMLTAKSLQTGYWGSRKAEKEFLKFEARVQPDVIYAQMVRTMRYAGKSVRPKVLDFQDALSMNMERRMAGKRGLRYFIPHYEFKMLRSAEYDAFDIFDALTIISERDSEAIPHHLHQEIHIVRNGVDFNYYQPLEREKRTSVVFCGNMQYKPNIEACKYLVNQVMPLVWKHYPQATVTLAGATPTATVRGLASDRVRVTGWVEDLREEYAASEIFVAPMTIGSGLQNKLLEAMAMGIPCVTTSLANESLHAEAGHDVLVGNDAEELAAHIVRLLESETLRKQLAAEAQSFVKKHFTWEECGKELENILTQAITTHHDGEKKQLEDE